LSIPVREDPIDRLPNLVPGVLVDGVLIDSVVLDLEDDRVIADTFRS
jgi:hypothetical protein